MKFVKTANNWRVPIVEESIVAKWTLLEMTVNMSSQRVQSLNYQGIVWGSPGSSNKLCCLCMSVQPPLNATFQTQDSQPGEHWTVTPWLTPTSQQHLLLIHVSYIAIREKEFFTGKYKMKEITAIKHVSAHLNLFYYLE